MIAFIDDHREHYGVEPICDVLPMAPSTYYERKAQERDPARRSARNRRDTELRELLLEVRPDGLNAVYGAKKTWKELTLAGVSWSRAALWSA